MLILPIEKKWFDMIKSGEKKEEYREIKDYYNKRLGKVTMGFPFTKDIIENFQSIRLYSEENANQFKNIDVIFRNGYNNNSPTIKCKVNLRIGQGKEEWGAEKRKRILHIRNIKKRVENPLALKGCCTYLCQGTGNLKVLLIVLL